MDPLRKLVSAGLRTQAPGPHPDAEVLSAFTEHALPEREREAVARHLSACTDCRDLLFLAAPEASEQQPVFLARKPRVYLALGWGTLVACIGIGAVMVVSYRPGIGRKELYSSAKQEAPPVQVVGNLAAEQKPAAERESMRDRPLGQKVAAPPPARGFAEPKPSTATPSAGMAFESSGEISVVNGAHLSATPKSDAVTDLPRYGLRTRELPNLASKTALGLPAPPTGQVAANRAIAGPASQNGYVGSAWSANSLDMNKPTSDPLGFVVGTISDPAGAVVSNAKVTATGPLGEKTAVSDDAGKFFFSGLAAGTYQLKVDAPGFRKALSQVAVASGKPATADVKLEVGQVAEVVTVEAAAAEVKAAPLEKPSRADVLVASGAETSALVSLAPTATEALKKEKASRSRRSATEKMAVQEQWSLSPQGVLERSSDGGKIWVPVAVADGGVFRAVASIGNQVWAGGNAGALYHSTDGGHNWTQVIPLSNGEKIQADITRIQFPDPEHVLLGTATGQGWASADSGQTWVRQ